MSDTDMTMDDAPAPTLSQKLEKLHGEGEALMAAVFEAFGTEDEEAALEALNEWGPVKALDTAFGSVTEDGEGLTLTDTDGDVYSDYDEIYAIFVWQTAMSGLWIAVIEAMKSLKEGDGEDWQAALLQAGDNAPWQSFLDDLNLQILETGLEGYEIVGFNVQGDDVLLIDSNEESFASAESFLENLEGLVDEGDEDFAGLPTIFDELYAEGSELFGAVQTAFEEGYEEGAAQALANLNAWEPIADADYPLVSFGLDEDQEMEEASFCVKCADDGTYVGFDDLFEGFVLEPKIEAKADEIIAGANPDEEVEAEMDELNALIQALQFFEPPEGEEGFGVFSIEFDEDGSAKLITSDGEMHGDGDSLVTHLYGLMADAETAEANADASDE